MAVGLSRDKISLCARTRGPGPQDPLFVSGLIFRESRYHILLVALFPSSSRLSYPSTSGPLSLIFCSPAFRGPPGAPFSTFSRPPSPPWPPSIVRCSSPYRGSSKMNFLSLVLDEHRTTLIVAVFRTILIMFASREYIFSRGKNGDSSSSSSKRNKGWTKKRIKKSDSSQDRRCAERKRARIALSKFHLRIYWLD